MDHNINISLITNQITNNRKKINNIDEYNNEKNQTNIACYDFFSMNQIKISEILTKIPYYSNYYDIFVDYDKMYYNIMTICTYTLVRYHDIISYYKASYSYSTNR